MTQLLEVLPELFSRSEIVICHFSELTDVDKDKNIQRFMQSVEARGEDPRQPKYRQEFNERVLANTDSRYLIGRYMEDRQDMLKGSHIAAEGRTFHLAVDIFSKDQEPVFAPCDGEIVINEKEPGDHGYGNYLILRPDDASLPYIFFGHLQDNEHQVGRVKAGEKIARLGSFAEGENGGWSIHLHLQLLTELPPEGEAPIGYTSKEDMNYNSQRFPDPFSIFPEWKVKR